MPHKHKRKRANDDTEFDLPPTETARPLPVGTTKQHGAIPGSQSTKQRRKGSAKNDDAPRAFKRLMAAAQGKKFKSGLDDGTRNRVAKGEPTTETLRIRPGEDLRSFASRVDAALPVSGLTKKTAVTKDGKDILGLKVHRTRKERKMHKLYDQWRAEERKIQEKKEEELELVAERDLENDAAGILSSSAFADENVDQASGRKKRNKKSRRGNTSVDEDPWLELKRRRTEAKVGLHDVALAPPELHKKTTKLLKVRGAAVDVDNVPRSAGSLRRREELQVTRNDVLEAYRKIREHEQSKLDSQR